MKSLAINATNRSQAGSAASGRLRAEERVPAVLYGKGIEPENLSVDAKELRLLLREIGNNAPIVQLKETEGEARTSIIREVQRHPIKDTYLHVDFQQIADDELISIDVPVHPIGEPFGVRNDDGTIETVSHTVLIRCLPTNLPASIDADVTDLHVGHSLHVSQLPEIEGVKYLNHPEQPVFAVVK